MLNPPRIVATWAADLRYPPELLTQAREVAAEIMAKVKRDLDAIVANNVQIPWTPDGPRFGSEERNRRLAVKIEAFALRAQERVLSRILPDVRR